MMRWLRAGSRLLLVPVGALSGAYCLMAYLPFTYQGVIQFNLVGWLPGFLRAQPWLLALAAALELGAAFAGPPTRLGPLRRGAAVLLGVLAGALLLRPVLVGLGNHHASYLWAVAFFALPLLVLGLDLAACPGREGPRPGADPSGRLAVAALAAGLGTPLLYAALGLAGGFQGFRLLAFSLALHGMMALLAAVGLRGSLALGRILAPVGLPEALGPAAFGGCLVAVLVRAQVFSVLGFTGPRALGLSLLAGLLVMAALAGLAQAAAPDAAPLPPLAELLPAPAWMRRAPGRVAWGLGWIALAWVLGRAVARFDWNFLFQKLVAAALWTLAFLGGWAAGAPGREGKDRTVRLYAWSALAVGVFGLAAYLAAHARPGLGEALRQELVRNGSLRLWQEVAGGENADAGSIYETLQRNSNLPHDVKTEPVDIRHVPDLRPTTAWRPDIFIVVVDSLRQDYVGAYNPKVAFTPALDAFAAEGTRFPLAFTRYGATGLSEPSIWTGAQMLHKQYVTPFQPMNSLRKLLAADGYDALVSMDSILKVVVAPWPGLRDLEPGVATQDLRLGASLAALSGRLKARPPEAAPVFAYTQCQDLHVSVLNRENRSVVDGGAYQGFDAPYASRVRAVDAAFGAFIADLKARGRYDDSLIVFTADHGDSLGEEGRYGHAYTLFPEIVKIPLLVHLPARWRGQVTAEPTWPAFLTDLTPSLYYLLGHGTPQAHPQLGRPLFVRRLQELAPFRQARYLLASSYGAVYGLLEDQGETLYIADGVNFRDYLYDVATGASRGVSAQDKRRLDALILEELKRLNAFYRFEPAP